MGQQAPEAGPQPGTRSKTPRPFGLAKARPQARPSSRSERAVVEGKCRSLRCGVNRTGTRGWAPAREPGVARSDLASGHAVARSGNACALESRTTCGCSCPRLVADVEETHLSRMWRGEPRGESKPRRDSSRKCPNNPIDGAGLSTESETGARQSARTHQITRKVEHDPPPAGRGSNRRKASWLRDCSRLTGAGRERDLARRYGIRSPRAIGTCEGDEGGDSRRSAVRATEDVRGRAVRFGSLSPSGRRGSAADESRHCTRSRAAPHGAVEATTAKNRGTCRRERQREHARPARREPTRNDDAT